MTSKDFSKLAGRLMRHPAAPYHEHAVRAEVEQICGEHKLDFKRDRFGNVLVRLQSDQKIRPVVLSAHLDHPGFEIVRSLSHGRWLARFLGGVPEAYFRVGTKLRLMPGGLPAKLGKRFGKDKQYEIHAGNAVVGQPLFAVWELEDFTARNGKIHGRACDDLIGVASILATLIQLKQRRARVNIIGVISRAEEVGFHGALTVATGKALPNESLVISLETSRELPGVQMGQGVILRVGDRSSIFDSAATRFFAEIGNGLQQEKKSFRFQRALMSGGTCEATAYQEFGFQTAAVCVALGNYHNCAERNRIATEYVSIADAVCMVELLSAAAKEMPQFSRIVSRLPRQLRKMHRSAFRRLADSAHLPVSNRRRKVGSCD